MAYEMVMPYHLHMPSYFLETFTEYPWIGRFSFDILPMTDNTKLTASVIFAVFYR